jgi:hypothetical protein
MRRFIFRFSILILAFSLGTGLASIADRVRPHTLQEIDTNHDRYAGKQVRARMLLYLWELPGNADPVYTGCSPCNSGGTGAVIIFANDVRTYGLAPYVFSRAEVNAKADGPIVLADVTVTGRVDETLGPGCFAPRLIIQNGAIEKIHSVHRFENRQQANDFEEQH